jgi:glycosyltransferase involved in cell wall biosynthesis
LHIAFVTPESPYGDAGVCGVAAYLRAIVPAIADAGHRVTVIANAKEARTFDAEKGRVAVRHFRLPALHWYSAKLPLVRSCAPLPLRQLEWSRAFYREAERVAAERKIDVIESTETGSLFLNRVAPLVIRLHGSEKTFRQHSQLPVNASVRWNDALEALACKRASAITSPSQSHANEMSRHRGWPDGKVQVIPNPISQELLNAATAFQRNGKDDRIVLYAGRLAPVKGIETLIEAAKLVRATDPSIKFVFAGPWQMPKTPQVFGLSFNDAKPNGLQWVGPQNQTELIDWYKRVSAVVIPSNYESFGLIAVEASAFGLPIVATDVGEVRELVDRKNLVPRNNPQALSDAIMNVIAKKAPGETMAARAARLQNYHPSQVAMATLKVYTDVLHAS